jgi:hypothetical protein
MPPRENFKRMPSRWLVRRNSLLVLVAAVCLGATRPHYGGVLRVELRDAIEEPDPPSTGVGMAQLQGPFAINRWEAGRRAVFNADENAPGGRPFLNSVDIQMARPMRDRAIELGRADVVELAPAELRRIPAGQRIWTSAPVRLVALVFTARVEDARVREALALAVDRAAIHNFLLQRQGDISGGLLPQWVSGYAFLFPAAADVARARVLLAGVPAALRTLSLASDDRPMADRIALNARDAGLSVSVVAAGAPADVRLAHARITSSNPAQALPAIASALGLAEPPRADTAEALYAAERALLDGFRVIPLFHLPDLYAVSARVKGGPGITPLGEWRFENLWLENAR